MLTIWHRALCVLYRRQRSYRHSSSAPNKYGLTASRPVPIVSFTSNGTVINNPKGMKESSLGRFAAILLTIVAVNSICSAVPVQDKLQQVSSSGHGSRSNKLHDELYHLAKRSRMAPMMAGAPSGDESWLDDKPVDPVEDMLTQLSTEELYRMLELLDMLESKGPIEASERELATLQYLLKNYQN